MASLQKLFGSFIFKSVTENGTGTCRLFCCRVHGLISSYIRFPSLIWMMRVPRCFYF